MAQFNNTNYKNEYKKKNYIRKEILFKKDEWLAIDNFLRSNNLKLKDIVMNVLKKGD